MPTMTTATVRRTGLRMAASSHANSYARALCQEVAKGVKAAGNEAVFDLGRRI